VWDLMSKNSKTPDTSYAEAIIKRIMESSVPADGQLTHPFKIDADKKENKQVTLADARNFKFPMDVKSWSPKMFVDYFAQKYQEEVNVNYRKMYKSDIMIIRKMGDFLVSNGLERNTWVKKLIDWAFRHRQQIINKEGHFTTQEVLRQINYFYQQEILPKVEENEIDRDTTDTLLLEEIQEADSSGKITEVFVRFGIPVALTYLVKIKKMNEDNLIKATEQRIKLLSSGSSLEKEQLEKMLHSSVIGSPYPDDFIGLDWRENFSSYINKYIKESWWRQEDYKGKPLTKYYSLI
jgi:hypothetical protein